ncbi:hypothetical protein ACQX0N_00395 [Clostridium tepidum]|jgi:hypothetical protein|uniref:DUF3784 domain-containing protein n=1 Tax=Clostridium tepidum TaxID=1962263 RepID=A0A1S9I1W1_9CLOT|nr:hypothetical protein [Clostridium tepidum]MCR1934818.1 hypothetical protein [Clostridium tepidum]MDU6878353.1 hypothetical protein [Clostridium botulinum]OOO62136.1 hypothetical protein BS637_08395 [Clostridium tepidum]OOO64331.1 hypothetical protein BS638_11025 [Clostridium tepidum]
MTNEFIVSLWIFGLISLFNIPLGLTIKKNKMVDIVSGYNSKRDDSSIVSKLLGDNLILMGVLGILITLIYFIIKDIVSVESYIIVMVSMTLGILTNYYIRWYNYRKHNKLKSSC